MKKAALFFTGLGFIFLVSGCVVRSYPLTRERVDQDMSAGNRGYLQGKADVPAAETERRTTRTTRVVEIELHPPVKFEKMPKPKPIEKTEDREVWGNRGYITGSAPVETEAAPARAAAAVPAMEKYTVAKNDTLQKIAQKFYGTTKKWTRIYDANRDQLKAPDKIYPGQTLVIPLDDSSAQKAHVKPAKKREALKETKENLK